MGGRKELIPRLDRPGTLRRWCLEAGPKRASVAMTRWARQRRATPSSCTVGSVACSARVRSSPTSLIGKRCGRVGVATIRVCAVLHSSLVRGGTCHDLAMDHQDAAWPESPAPLDALVLALNICSCGIFLHPERLSLTGQSDGVCDLPPHVTDTPRLPLWPQDALAWGRRLLKGRAARNTSEWGRKTHVLCR